MRLTSLVLWASITAWAQSPPAWVAKSNQNSQLLVDILARYSPEQAAQMGAPGLDEQISTLSPEQPERFRRDTAVARIELQKRLAAEKDPLVRQDLEILIAQADRDIRTSEATERNLLPYTDVAGQIFSGMQSLLDDQVTELARNKLRSQLDVSFADVNVSEAKLLLLRARDSVAGALAELGRAMGSDQPAGYRLSDEPLPPAPPAAADTLVAQAIENRPELASLRASRDAARRFADAERDLTRPTVSAVAVGGYMPYINTASISPEYEGVGANVSIPIFNGHLFSARREAAYQRALESDQRLRDEQDRISRDVRVAWASAYDAYQRIDVTAQFLRQASLAMQLAQGRYDLSLASIVELTQAQLNVTAAEIENLSAKYDYQTQYAVLEYTVGALR